MARPYRLQGENCCYHITSRGDGRKDIYKSEGDYLKFLEYIKKGKERYKFYLYAYALMSNHYHLLLETRQANISRIMQYLNTSYTTYYNVKRNKSGHLFQGRYKSILVEKESYFLELTKYIHLNPLRAKMVKKPEEYRWTSYRGYIGREKDEYIDRERIKEIMEMSGRSYEEFVRAGMGKEIKPFKELYAGFILGRTRFIKEKLDEIKDQVEGSKEVSYEAQISRELAADDIIRIIEKKYNKKIEQITGLKKVVLPALSWVANGEVI